MKKIYVLLAISLCIGGSAIAVEQMEVASQEVAKRGASLGEESVAVLRKDYLDGKFDLFLDTLEDDYQDLQKSGRFEEFAEMRRVPAPDEQTVSLAKQFEQLALGVTRERNEALIKLCDGQESDSVCRKVLSILSPSDDSESDAMNYLASLRFKTVDVAKNADEKKLIEIDTAYEFKSVHLDLQKINGQEIGDLSEKQMVLSMDKMQKMIKASETFSDVDLKEKVALAAKGFDKRLAKNWDLRQLIAAGRHPSNDLEKQIGSILSSYQAKKDDLYQKEFLAKLD